MESHDRPRPLRAVLIPIGLFLLTLLCTTGVGACFADHFQRNTPGLDPLEPLYAAPQFMRRPELLVRGLPYSLTLMAILLAHELGHYFACRYHKVACTLPYFLPVPFLIGTFGAFIRFRSAVKSRKELFDVGIAGPLAGFVLVMPVLIVGLALSRVVPQMKDGIETPLALPALFHWLAAWILPGCGIAELNLHPMARAAWVGLLATSLNLLPVGQLDGGHLIYAWLGERHKWVSLAVILLLGAMGFLFPPWFIWAGALLLVGRRHFPVYDRQGLDRRRKILLAVAGLIFVMSFIPAPLIYSTPLQ